MALSRTLVRLRNEVAAIVSRPLEERDVGPLYQLGTAKTLRRLLTEEYGTVVADTNTVVAGWSLGTWPARRLRHEGRLCRLHPVVRRLLPCLTMWRAPGLRFELC